MILRACVYDTRPKMNCLIGNISVRDVIVSIRCLTRRRMGIAPVDVPFSYALSTDGSH